LFLSINPKIHYPGTLSFCFVGKMRVPSNVGTLCDAGEDFGETAVLQ
jgi:hypothetical protein